LRCIETSSRPHGLSHLLFGDHSWEHFPDDSRLESSRLRDPNRTQWIVNFHVHIWAFEQNAAGQHLVGAINLRRLVNLGLDPTERGHSASPATGRASPGRQKWDLTSALPSQVASFNPFSRRLFGSDTSWSASPGGGRRHDHQGCNEIFCSCAPLFFGQVPLISNSAIPCALLNRRAPSCRASASPTTAATMDRNSS